MVDAMVDAMFGTMVHTMVDAMVAAMVGQNALPLSRHASRSLCNTNAKHINHFLTPDSRHGAVSPVEREVR